MGNDDSSPCIFCFLAHPVRHSSLFTIEVTCYESNECQFISHFAVDLVFNMILFQKTEGLFIFL